MVSGFDLKIGYFCNAFLQAAPQGVDSVEFSQDIIHILGIIESKQTEHFGTFKTTFSRGGKTKITSSGIKSLDCENGPYLKDAAHVQELDLARSGVGQNKGFIA